MHYIRQRLSERHSRSIAQKETKAATLGWVPFDVTATFLRPGRARHDQGVKWAIGLNERGRRCVGEQNLPPTQERRRRRAKNTNAGTPRPISASELGSGITWMLSMYT